jgi:hypothetical protein
MQREALENQILLLESHIHDTERQIDIQRQDIQQKQQAGSDTVLQYEHLARLGIMQKINHALRQRLAAELMAREAMPYAERLGNLTSASAI